MCKDRHGNTLEVGDKVRRLTATGPGYKMQLNSVVTLTYTYVNGDVKVHSDPDDVWSGHFFELVEKASGKKQENQQESGENMNETIAKMYEKTADAVLVNKHFAGVIPNNPVSFAIHNPVKDEILAAAKEKEAEVKK